MARKARWLDNIVSLSNATAGQVSQQLDESLNQDERLGMTIVRIIGELNMFSTTVAGAWGVQHAVGGIGLVSAEAEAAGIFPDPETASDRPVSGWLYRHSSAVSQNGAGTGVVTRLTFDLRSKRMMKWGELRYIQDNNPVVGTTFTVFTIGLVRVAVLLP